MSKLYLNLYNNFINLTINKKLYKDFSSQDTFSDRLIFFLLHFAFFLKTYKNDTNSKILQEIYDFNFRQLELTLREIGYGDQSINKKMKIYINTFHSIISDIHFWENQDLTKKAKVIYKFFTNPTNYDYLIQYFDNFSSNLSKKTLNSYLKSVSNSDYGSTKT